MQTATTDTQLAAPLALPRAGVRERWYGLAVGASTGAVGLFLALRLTAWPPHEDEALPLFVGQGPFSGLLDTVLGERGGAPLHFVLAWVVEHLGGGLTGLRLISAVFAVASLPLVAELVRRLSDRATAALATALVASSWVLLFHAVYGRMYSLFLFLATLSYLALLAALRHGGAARWALWAGAILLTVATHPYGALVLASQGLFVLAVRERLREAIAAFAAVAVLGTPFWITDLVLAGRFDVGVGGAGGRLGGPLDAFEYLGEVAADFSPGPIVLPITLGFAAVGFGLLLRTRPRSALLAACAVGTPALAFLVARLGSGAAPETRHLIFALPFFALAVATTLVAVARSGRRHAVPVAAVASTLFVGGAVAHAWHTTPLLFTGEPAERVAARAEATDYLVRVGRPDDILLGYEPLYLDAWERSDAFSRHVLPRADARLAAEGLEKLDRPLGHGLWVLNAFDTTNAEQRLSIRLRYPRPASLFEARAFGPFLVLRSKEPVGTTDRYLELAASAMLLGKLLGIGDADINHATISRVAERLGYTPSNRSRSTSSR